MERHVTAHLSGTVGPDTELALQVAVADDWPVSHETLRVSVDGLPRDIVEHVDAHGTRVHVVTLGRDERGTLDVTYEATVRRRAPRPAVEPLDLIRYLRPSRYCESDALAPTAAAEFGGLSGRNLLEAVSSWVGTQLSYVSGSSLPTDGAVRTLLARQGVCRDYAHLCVALLRARGVPARVVAVYAPGLAPMDFHAVAEAHVDGGWHVVDATTLAPRGSLVRIATGRDASDTAFLSTVRGSFALDDMQVTAVSDSLPTDDLDSLVQLS